MDDRHAGSRHSVQIEPHTAEVFSIMSAEFADAYINEFLLRHLSRLLGASEVSLEAVGKAWQDPFLALKSFFGHYAFARRGKERDDLSHAAVMALNATVKERTMDALLQEKDGTSLWDAFYGHLERLGKKSNEEQNRGVLQGMLELAQEIYREDGIGSIPGWVARRIEETGRLEPEFERIVDIRGVGPKCTSTYLRDVVLACGIEDLVEASDIIYIQPVDRWLRIAAEHLVPEEGMETAADWIVAGKIGKYARRAGASPLRFGMGVTYFGQRVARDPRRFGPDLKAVASGRLTAKDASRLF